MKKILGSFVCVVALATSVVAPAGVQAQEAGDVPETRTFEFNSEEDHGAFQHCVVEVTRSTTNPDQLLPSDETCFTNPDAARLFAEEGELPRLDDNGNLTGSQLRAIFNDGLIAVHYEGRNFTGASLAIAGVDCAGGGITFTGGAWDNRIRSTENGCSWTQHYDLSSDFFFGGRVEATTGTGGNLARVVGTTSGVLYKGIPVRVEAPRARIAAIEINQALDVWQSNSVPGVAKKPTMVRVFAESPQRVSGLLEVRRDGALIQTLLPENGGAARQGSFPGTDVEIEQIRLDQNGSLNFYPRTSSLFGNLTFDFVASVPSECAGPDLQEINGVCRRSRTFTSIPPIDMVFIAVEGVVDGTLDRLTNTELREQAARVADQWPVPTVQLGPIRRATTEFEITDVYLRKLAARAKDADYNAAPIPAARAQIARTIYVGIAPSSLSIPNLGLLGEGVGGNIGVFVFPSETPSRGGTTQFRNVLAHEVGHILGRSHTSGSSCDGAGGTPYPYLGTLRRTNSPVVQARIAPDGPIGTQTWGFAPRLRFLDPTKAIIDPELSSTVMSYCTGNIAAGQTMWADRFNYPIVHQNLSIGGNPASRNGNFLLVTGSIDDTGSIELDPALPATAASIEDQPGDHVVELLDQTGSVVASSSFSPVLSDKVLDAEVPPTDGGLVFRVPIDIPVNGFTTVRVSSPSGSTASLTGGQAPAIDVLTPSPVSGEGIEVAWTFEDPDSTDLEFIVQYSSDNGTTFTTYESGLSTTQTTVPAGTLPGSATAVVRVIALDGTNRSEAVSEQFVIANTTPEVDLSIPNTGTIVATTDQLIITGYGNDLEDGDLSENIIWASDLDGPLGSGSEVTLVGDLATPGTHQITASVTDANGESAVAEAEVVIAATNAVPEVVIEEPVNGAIVLDTDGVLGLQAAAFDPEDDYAVGPVEWTSSIDGSLGGGNSLFVDPLTLSPGTHEITATVTDTAGASTSQSVQITINAGPQAPAAIDDIAAVSTDAVEQIDVLDNDSDRNDNLDPASLSVTTPPTTGTATVLAGTSGPTIEYTAPGTDTTDSFEYQICDLTGLCDTATVTVTVGFAGCTIIGTPEDDLLVGTPGDDVICGGLGNDTLQGLGGNDVLRGGAGSDAIEGGAGADLIFGEAGDDNLSGGRGSDGIHGGSGSDTINGNRGSDLLYGGRGADSISGGRGHDLILGGRKSDTLSGGDGNDEIRGNRGADHIDGNDGADVLIGGRGSDTIKGGKGSDLLLGGRGEDTLRGNRGHDGILGGAGNDDIEGGQGIDFCKSPSGGSSCEY